MINFVGPAARENPKLAHIRRMGVAVTTGVLVAYIVGVAGFIGWGVYWSARQSRASSSLDQVTAQVNQLAASEVLARKLSDRLDGIATFLQSRSNLTADLNNMDASPAGIIGWAYDSSGRVTIQAQSQNLTDIKTFTDFLVGKFSNVQVDSMAWTPLDNWIGTIAVKGVKP